MECWETKPGPWGRGGGCWRHGSWNLRQTLLWLWFKVAHSLMLMCGSKRIYLFILFDRSRWEWTERTWKPSKWSHWQLRAHAPLLRAETLELYWIFVKPVSGQGRLLLSQLAAIFSAQVCNSQTQTLKLQNYRFQIIFLASTDNFVYKCHNVITSMISRYTR